MMCLQRERKIRRFTPCPSPPTPVTPLELQKTTRHSLKRVARAPISPMPVAVRVHCGLSLSCHPSRLADYSPSCPSPKHHPQAIKTPRRTLPPQTTITLTDLTPNTAKADIRLVFQRFGEVTRILIEPDRKCAAVVFADVHGVKDTLHACLCREGSSRTGKRGQRVS